MAQIMKRCDCPRDKWGKCSHSWTVRWWGVDGKQHEKSFKRNYQLATKHAKLIEAEKLSVHRGDPLPPARRYAAPRYIPLQEYAEQWLDNLPAPRNTVRAYRSALNNHVLPQHGRRPLTEFAVDREGMQSLLNALTPGTARAVSTAIRSMLTEAKSSGRITDDRLTRLRLRPLSPLEFTFPAYPQLAGLAAGMGALGPAVWIMRGCGLRPGEALAVRGAAFSGGRLRVSEQRLLNGDYAPLKARKPGEYRDVPVPSYVTAAIAGLGDGRLFDVPRSTFQHRIRKAADAAGLKGFRAHDLRHVFASVALAAGVPVTDVSRWLGHRSIEITYRTYSHFIPDSWDQARAALDQEYARWAAGVPEPSIR